MNNKIVSLKRFSALFLAIVLVTGTIAISSSSFMIDAAQAQAYYGVDNNYEKSKDISKSISVNKIKCINDNININGVNAGNISIGNKGQGYLGAYSSNDGGYDSEGYYDNGYKQGKGFDDCIINNNNTNTNIIISGNQTIPPEPEPTTGTLTVNKEVFGCDNIRESSIVRLIMDCGGLQNDSPQWISCDNPPISNTFFIEFCQTLTEDLFDIEVLDDQGNQITQFEGSVEGTTIQNLEPGTYTVNETKAAIFVVDQLFNNPSIQNICTNLGFADGGELLNPNMYDFWICFEYEDEQGNDCSTIALAAGEERTCTVKNYIVRGVLN